MFLSYVYTRGVNISNIPEYENTDYRSKSLSRESEFNSPSVSLRSSWL